MEQLLVFTVVIVLTIFWVILPIYRKITGTNLDSNLWGEYGDSAQNEAINKIPQKYSDKQLFNIYKKASQPNIIHDGRCIEIREKVADSLKDKASLIYILENEEEMQVIEKVFNNKWVNLDDEDLIKIANSTKKEDVKFEALKNISDTKIAIDLGLASNSENTKLWAIKQCSDQEKIIKIAENDSNKNVRLKAINKNENQASLCKIATEDADKENRLSALNRIKEDNYLIKIVNDTKKEDVKFEVLKNISDTKIAIDLGLASNSENTKLWAIKQCSDQEKIIKIAENDSNKNVRLKAINKNENQASLCKIATEDADKENRLSALNRIKEDKYLIAIVNEETDGALKLEALKRINETKIAVDIGLSIKNEDVKLWALNKCEDQDKIVEIAEKDDNQRIRLIAVEKIENQETLIKIAKDSSRNMKERDRVIGMIRSDSELFQMLVNPIFVDVHDIIRNRYPEVNYKEQQNLLEKFKETKDEKEKNNILKRITNIELLTKLYLSENTKEKLSMLELFNDNSKLIKKIAVADGEKGAKEIYDSGKRLNNYQIAEIKDENFFRELYSKEKHPEEKEKIFEATKREKNLLIIVEQETDIKLQRKAILKITDIDILKSLVPVMKKIIGGQFFELPNNNYDKSKALCSDNECPCPETEYNQGEGYLYVPKNGNPIFMCENGANLRGINIDKAALNAKLWWAAGIVKQRIQKIEKNKNIDSESVVLCCSNSACNGRISSKDAKLKNYLNQLSRGAIIAGNGITCADCGINSSLNDWHKETVKNYGKNYLNKGEDILNSEEGIVNKVNLEFSPKVKKSTNIQPNKSQFIAKEKKKKSALNEFPPIDSVTDVQNFIFDVRDKLMAGSMKGEDSTMVVWKILNHYNLCRAMITFFDFEKAQKILNYSVNSEGGGLVTAASGLSRTKDGAVVVLGGDLRPYQEKWIELFEIINQGRDEFQIEQAIFFNINGEPLT